MEIVDWLAALVNFYKRSSIEADNLISNNEQKIASKIFEAKTAESWKDFCSTHDLTILRLSHFKLIFGVELMSSMTIWDKQKCFVIILRPVKVKHDNLGRLLFGKTELKTYHWLFWSSTVFLLRFFAWRCHFMIRGLNLRFNSKIINIFLAVVVVVNFKIV